MPKSRVCEVLIVGGGLAGLACANYLNEVGMNDFLIVDSANRLGGRIYSDTEHGIEIGAEYVHGEGSMLYDILVNKLGVKLDLSFDFGANNNTKEHGVVYFANGQVLTVDHPFVKKAFGYIDELFEGKDLEEDMSLKQYLVKKGVPEEYHVFIDSLVAKTNGCCLLTQSARGAQEEAKKGIYGERNFQLNGDSYMETTVVKYLKRNISLKDQVLLNYQVRSIDYTDKQMINVNNGEIFCNKLVLTVPLSMLRNNAIQFSPQLSPLKQHIIQNMLHMHAGMKVVLRYKRPFWRELLPDVNLILLSDEDPIFAQIWFPHTTQEKHDKYGYYLTGFSTSNKTDNALILSNEEVSQKLRKLVQKVFKLNDNNDGFIDGISKNWSHFTTIGGAYSYAHVSDASKTHFIKDARVTLAEPIENRIFFAGEAYCDYAPATIHGSMETGVRVAESLVTRQSKL
ncbi:hypothetical protein ABK040_010351 [Willaertia magna]